MGTKTDRITIGDVPSVWVDRRLLILTLDVLLSRPFPLEQGRRVSVETMPDSRDVMIHILVKFNQEYTILENDPIMLSSQIGIEQRKGSLDWKRASRDALEITVGLPRSKGKQSSNEETT